MKTCTGRQREGRRPILVTKIDKGEEEAEVATLSMRNFEQFGHCKRFDREMRIDEPRVPSLFYVYYVFCTSYACQIKGRLYQYERGLKSDFESNLIGLKGIQAVCCSFLTGLP